MTYNERLNDLAEKIAKVFYQRYFDEMPTGIPLDTFTTDQNYASEYKMLIDEMIPLVEVCFEENKKDATWFYRQGWVDGENGTPPHVVDYLKELGLIP